MVEIVILSFVHLLLFGLVVIQGTWARSQLGEKPTLYSSELINFILNIGLLLWIILSGVIVIFIDWKLLVGLFVVGVILGRPILYSLAEYIIVLPFYTIVMWLYEKNIKK